MKHQRGVILILLLFGLTDCAMTPPQPSGNITAKMPGREAALLLAKQANKCWSRKAGWGADGIQIDARKTIKDTYLITAARFASDIGLREPFFAMEIMDGENQSTTILVKEGDYACSLAIECGEPVLSPDDLSFWDENGYVALRDAVSANTRTKAANLIWEHVGADPDSPDSWYGGVAHGIMVELIQHPALEENRRNARIHKAFAQLWRTADLWVTADRCGFHPPQRNDRPFPGPDLHWDIDFAQPLTFGTPGILYLTDTPPEQGALTLVPGFHHRLSGW